MRKRRRWRGMAVALPTIALALAAVALPAKAQSAPPPEIAAKVELCASCHGADGKPVLEGAPIIWGQQMFYLLTQLRDYRAGRRANETMSPVAAELSDEETKALAEFFSAQPWPAVSFAASEEQTAAAESTITSAQCPQCHLATFRGDSRIPRVANQMPDYLNQTMLDLKNGVRKNAQAMSSLLRDVSDEDIAALADYLASL